MLRGAAPIRHANLIMEKKLTEWFNKTGYPFELWTEALFTKYGFRVENGNLYQDQENQEHRELDLIASKDWSSEDGSIDFVLNLLVECKKSDKPFIILRSTTAQKAQVSAGSYYCVDDVHLIPLLLSNGNSRIALPGKTSQGFKLVQGFVTGDETPRKAIHTLIKSHNAWIKTDTNHVDHHIKDNYNSFALPILVLDAPLFELGTDTDGAISLKAIDSGVVDQLSHLTRAPHSPFPIPIIRKESLHFFIQEALKYGKEQYDHLVANPLCQIRNAPKVTMEFRSSSGNLSVPLGDALRSKLSEPD